MAYVGPRHKYAPRIGCCGATCGDSCAACCDNVVYEDTITFTFRNAWEDDPLADPPCFAGSDTVEITLSRIFSDLSSDPGHEGEYLDPSFHPCVWMWEVGRPMKLSMAGPTFTPACGDYSVTTQCRPSGFASCYTGPLYITRALFYSICKVAPQPLDSPYFGMPEIGDGTQEPANCTVTAGTSKAGWVGNLGGTTSPLCLADLCNLNFDINKLGIGTAPGDTTAFKRFGLCTSGSEGCDPWSCCPFLMTFIYGSHGGWMTNLPDDVSLREGRTTPDYISCADNIAHQGDIDYALDQFPSVTVTANHTCTPSGMDMMARLRAMPDSRLKDLVRKLLAEKARAAV
jgi:hypothetical protein